MAEDKIPKRNIDEKRWRWSKWIALVFKIHTPGFFKICIYIYIYIRKIYIKYKNISEKYINKKIYPPSFLGMMRTCNEHTVPYT